ncbi:MAG: sialidase family protein, partial [Blastocatellia bacterium]
MNSVGTVGNCDDYVLTVNGNPADWVGKRIRIRFSWVSVATDYDMAVYKETNGTAGLQGDGVTPTPPLDSTIGTSGRGTSTEEEVVISPADSGTGVYYVRSIYFAATPADQYAGTATVFSVSTTLNASSCALPTYDNYQPPVGYPRRDGAPEPSIGINWNTGNVMTMSRLRCNRTTFSDTTSPANPTTGATWFSQTSPLIATGLDPILFTDSITGRTICGELNGAGGATNGGISDDDLATFTASFQTGGPTQGADHQTIGGGPPNPTIANRQPTGSYPHLFYYASQQIAYASVATSFDGGITYQPAVPAYTLAQCGGLHGHIKVAQDGTVYLPNKGCGGKTGLAVSENNGLNWSLRTIPTSSSGRSDPAVAIGTGGRVYVGYAASDNHPHVAVSDDRGLTWRDDFDLASGVSPSLTAIVFPQAVAGDNNRAAIFFLGTSSTNPGNPVGDDTGTVFAGTWFPYIATTCDGGKSWSVVKADNDPLNPGVPNPAQQGVVCTNGTTCPGGPPDTRNLADFNEITVDSRGRIVAVYADGCNFGHPCTNILDNSGTKANNQGTARLTIIRQRGGTRLFSV